MATETKPLLYLAFTLTWPAQPGRPAGHGTFRPNEPLTVEEATVQAARHIPGAVAVAIEASRVEAEEITDAP